MSRTHTYFHLIGWLLFLVCAVLFVVSGLRAGDRLLVAGSLVFLIACIAFIIPTLSDLRSSRGARTERDDKLAKRSGDVGP